MRKQSKRERERRRTTARGAHDSNQSARIKLATQIIQQHAVLAGSVLVFHMHSQVLESDVTVGEAGLDEDGLRDG